MAFASMSVRLRVFLATLINMTASLLAATTFPQNSP